MADDMEFQDWSEDGGTGVGTVEAPSVNRARSRASTFGASPPALPEVGVASHSPGWIWLKAFFGGLLLCLVLFSVLGWIQPVFKKNERIEIPQAVQVLLKGGAEAKKSKSIAKSNKPKQRESRPERVTRSKTSRVRRSAPIQPVAAQSRRSSDSLLKNISMAPAIGGPSGGGVGIALSFDNEDQQVLQQAKDLRQYEERRRQIRGDRGGSRGESRGLARGGAGEIGGLGGGMSTGEAAFLPGPEYPKRAAKEQVEGWVKVRLLVSVTGTVEKFDLVAAQPEGYFEKAIEEVLPRWRYSPAMDDAGRPIEFWDEVTYQFKLEDAL